MLILSGENNTSATTASAIPIHETPPQGAALGMTESGLS
jgi:hypothetical protein